MELVVNAANMRQLEEKVMADGLPAAVLMERAALFAAKHVEKELQRARRGQKNRRRQRILIVCGMGNNGADGLALARILYEHSWQPQVWLVGDMEKQSQLNGMQYELLMKWPFFQEALQSTKPVMKEYDIIVDALLGIGLGRPLKGKIANAVKWMNAQDGYKLALDIPTGISSDTGEMLGNAFLANKTVTFGAYKAGLFLEDGKRCAGRIRLDTCGMQYRREPQELQLFCFTRQDLYPLLKRDPQGNKGSFGKLGIFAGSERIAGAAKLCTQAAFLSGAGYVKLLTHEKNRKLLLDLLPETVLMSYAHKQQEAVLTAQEEKQLYQLYEFADVIAAGPGIGQSHSAKLRLDRLLTLFMEETGDQDTCKKLVLDADALNLVSGDKELLEKMRQVKAPVILTPHMLEFSRLCGLSIEQIRRDKIRYAREFACANHVILILKDAQTVVAAEDGRICIGTRGNDGMAVAGSGDTLCGIVTALVAKAREPFSAAYGAVYLHGLAADRAKKRLGAHSMRPTDLAAELIPIYKKLGKEAKDL